MEDRRVVCTTGLVSCLEKKENASNLDDPFYWYNHLNEIGKRAQTEEIVYEAVNQFNVVDPRYLILDVVARKYLTRPICEIAVRKNGLNLKHVPESLRDEEMSLMAVSNDGDALSNVPNSILCCEKSYEICYTAVCNSSSGNALYYVPKSLMHAEKGRRICEAAVRANGYAIKWVPKRFLRKELVQIALEAPVSDFPQWWSAPMRSPDFIKWWNASILSMIPSQYISEEVVAAAARRWPKSLKDAPLEYITPNLCAELVETDPMNLAYVPISMMNRRLIDDALKANPRVILCLPENKLTLKRCLEAFRRDPTIPINRLPDAIFDYLEKNMEAFIAYEPIALKTPDFSENSSLPVQENNVGAQNHDLANLDGSFKRIYYITDIHLEHQLAKHPHDMRDMSVYEIKRRIDERIAELVASASDATGLLLIGGDVADSIALEKLFYERLSSWDGWRGKIIAVLGNHELWDGDPTGTKPVRLVDEIIGDYRQAMPKNVTLLENELFIVYKGQTEVVLAEQTILNASLDELYEVCSNSTFILLGGIGFSGLNPIYNAEMGLYRAAVSFQEDFERSKRFRAVYEKVLASAKELPVVVLTHTRMEDWSNERYNPGWVYVNGHTHQNRLLLDAAGIAVFADNQVGYTPKSWHLNSFSLDARTYDPFKDYPDGVYKISHEQYLEFNQGQGILIQGMKYPGNLYALKRDGVYMFVLESKNGLCLLEGGRRHKLNHDFDYYDSHLFEYVQKVRSIFAPYHKALSIISEEIRSFGGTGTVHGCIVDIDWFHHVYLNPFDGKITPYYATDMTNKLVYKDVKSLLQSSPILPRLSDGASLLAHYLTAADDGKIPILSRKSNKKWKLATVPEVVLDKSMYMPSRIMRSIQYIFDKNVLRVWDDGIFSKDNETGAFMPSAKLIEP